METDTLPQFTPPPLSLREQAKILRITQEAWRELGFWYDCSLPERCWKFRADRHGLAAFALILRRFVAAPVSQNIGEHIHLGPFSHLRIVAARQPFVSARGFEGRREDLKRLAAELDSLKTRAAIGQHALGKGFGSVDGFHAIITVEAPRFDPAKADPMTSQLADN